MEELVKVGLDNEMDLILAHKRAMKLSELAGLSLAAQTTFATAVSEVARYAMEHGGSPVLSLGADRLARGGSLIAIIEDKNLSITNPLHQGLMYAQRLVDKLEITNTGKSSLINLYYSLPVSRRIKPDRFADWRAQFRADLPVSAYDEIKQKNDQLQQLALRLQASEEHYKRVTNSLPLMIFTINQAGQILYGNDWVSQFTGCSLQTLNQTKWAPVLHPDDFIVFWEMWNQQTVHSQAFRWECRLKEAGSQTYMWHLISAQPVKGESEKVTLWTGFGVNIHAQKIVGQTLRENKELAQAKQELEHSQQELKVTIDQLNESNNKLSQFAYIASHDLQEPLRKIQQFGDLLKTRNANLPSEDLTYLERMQAAAGRMSTLIKDLLIFSRLSTRREVALPISLSQVVSLALDNLLIPIQETGAQIQLNPLPVVVADASQIGQLFQNLLSNAIKFHQPQTIPQITVKSELVKAIDLPNSLKHTSSAEQFYRIDVADNGIGFDEKYLDRIFQVFQRLHSSREYSGTGVGLAICEKVVNNHGGVITATSQPNQGATFSVYLPA
ncbi:ATP-binding protein [Spirosoma sp. SC4-14]|uniref:sensor histidine kinase n=1 Tax=Spirosoma sp. SC4-14 TaxID=3128900 RepID=UPI0030CB7761